jgi:catechol 2,3-dioxygenase-like lactoylglutathione lyase family enzyme
MDSTPPPLSCVLETVLYFTNQARMEAFYSDVLGMKLIDRELGRHLFYRAGRSVFLLFRADETLRSEKLPPHGARGPAHTCFLVPVRDYDGWQTHLRSSGVEVLQEIDWSRGRSFYFHDPDGNVLEIANADIWPV